MVVNEINDDQMAKPLLLALRGKSQLHPPIWLMRQAGRYLSEYRNLRSQAGSFLNLCYNPKLAAAVTLQPVERFGLDAAILFSDILLIPDALGQTISFVEGDGPKLNPVRNLKDLENLNSELNVKHLSPVYETVSAVASQLDQNVALIGFAGAPWTVAAYMVEGQTSRHFDFVKHWAFSDPSSFEVLITRLIDATVVHLCKQIEAGADAVQLFESWAGVLPSKEFARWCIKPVEIITKRVKAKFPGTPVIAFPRGAGVGYVGYAGATGVDGLGVDYTLPTKWIATVLQPNVCVQGNLDPQILLVGGRMMEAAVREIKNVLNNGPFVFNLGHGVLPQTPPEHVAELVQLVRED